MVIILILEDFLIGCCFFLNMLFGNFFNLDFGLVDIFFKLDIILFGIFFNLDILCYKFCFLKIENMNLISKWFYRNNFFCVI